MFGEIPVKHELPRKQGEICFNPLSSLCERDERRFPILLIKSIWDFRANVGRFEKGKLHGCADISTVSENAAVVMFIFDIIQIIDIVNIRFGDIKGMDDTAESAYGMPLVSIIEGVLRCAKAIRGGGIVVGPPESAS